MPSDAATDPDFGGPGGMALWRPTEFPAFASAYAHRGEHASSHPCRTAESPLGRTSARPGGFVRRDAAARGAERRCRTRALSRVRRIFDTRTHRRALCASVKNLSWAPAKCGSGEHRRTAPMTYRRTCTICGCAPFSPLHDGVYGIMQACCFPKIIGYKIYNTQEKYFLLVHIKFIY